MQTYDQRAKRTGRARAQLRLQLLDPRGLRLVDAPQLGARPGVACAAVPCAALWPEGRARRTPQLGDLRSLCGDGRVERGDRPLLGGARGAQRALELCSPELALPWATTGPHGLDHSRASAATAPR